MTEERYCEICRVALPIQPTQFDPDSVLCAECNRSESSRKVSRFQTVKRAGEALLLIELGWFLTVHLHWHSQIIGLAGGRIPPEKEITGGELNHTQLKHMEGVVESLARYVPMFDVSGRWESCLAAFAAIVGTSLAWVVWADSLWTARKSLDKRHAAELGVNKPKFWKRCAYMAAFGTTIILWMGVDRVVTNPEKHPFWFLFGVVSLFISIVWPFCKFYHPEFSSGWEKRSEEGESAE